MEAEILQRLYDSGINFKISCEKKYGFSVHLEINILGVSDEWITYRISTAKEAYEFLIKIVLKHYPDSDFAKWWRSQNGK